MTTTERQETPPQTPPAHQLVSSRKKKKTGMPKSGICIIVGYPKTGKSKFTASFPNSYVLNMDCGDADHIDGRIEDIEDVVDAHGNIVKTKLDNFREALMVAIKDPSIEVIVIDTIDTLVENICDEIANKAGLSKITDRLPGVDGFSLWGELGARIDGMINLFKKSGKLFILNAHLREPKLDDNNKVITPAGINVPGKSGDKLAFAADMIGYTFKREVGGKTEYCLTFQGGVAGRWGSRVEELSDKTIKLDGDNPYKSFAALFTEKAAMSETAESAKEPEKKPAAKTKGGK
ncbi:MAG: AAA family ATPase [Elusimicrobia bacterium]|nr:AAA family ATPase [Elusimicrobiota bacterium]